MSKTPVHAAPAPVNLETCGVVMPISSLDGCDEQHWSEVKCILFDAITESGLDPSLVSDADDVGVIQARIVKNLYENPIVVCDVSGRNANVMFELGLRLAFDRPTVIVIDDKTPFSFDTSPIEHLRYPRDLRYAKIEKFKKDLSDKLSVVIAKSKEPGYSTFLKHFGSFTASKIDKKELAPAEAISFITQKLTEIDESVAVIRSNMRMAEKSQISARVYSPPSRQSDKTIEETNDENQLDPNRALKLYLKSKLNSLDRSLDGSSASSPKRVVD